MTVLEFLFWALHLGLLLVLGSISLVYLSGLFSPPRSSSSSPSIATLQPRLAAAPAPGQTPPAASGNGSSPERSLPTPPKFDGSNPKEHASWEVQVRFAAEQELDCARSAVLARAFVISCLSGHAATNAVLNCTPIPPPTVLLNDDEHKLAAINAALSWVMEAYGDHAATRDARNLMHKCLQGSTPFGPFFAEWTRIYTLAVGTAPSVQPVVAEIKLRRAIRSGLRTHVMIQASQGFNNLVAACRKWDPKVPHEKNPASSGPSHFKRRADAAQTSSPSPAPRPSAPAFVPAAAAVKAPPGSRPSRPSCPTDHQGRILRLSDAPAIGRTILGPNGNKLNLWGKLNEVAGLRLGSQNNPIRVPSSSSGLPSPRTRTQTPGIDQELADFQDQHYIAENYGENARIRGQTPAEIPCSSCGTSPSQLVPGVPGRFCRDCIVAGRWRASMSPANAATYLCPICKGHHIAPFRFQPPGPDGPPGKGKPPASFASSAVLGASAHSDPQSRGSSTGSGGFSNFSGNQAQCPQGFGALSPRMLECSVTFPFGRHQVFVDCGSELSFVSSSALGLGAFTFEALV
ncbi:hypothetical protein L873DRAFT_1790822 [Choiromyces venosus 120613-1]|uniref:Uncharacterized protein n=1 Tax=Choiromyces venosus 120613-1 TaxID=1336337 RepID=A0A3N4JL05_9PEZI|nr:hypothetical protein L873DRAFT_1790822 [Choiromyces venosus 120613-1]